MFRCKIQDRSTVKCTGLDIISDISEDYVIAGEKKALVFLGDDTIKIDEEGLRFDGFGDYIGTSVLVPENAPKTVRFLSGERIPFHIDFVKENEEGYRIRFEVETEDGFKRVSKKTMESRELLIPGKWCWIDVLIFDGEFYLVVDGKVWIRRIFEAVYHVSSYGALCFGGNGLFMDTNCFFHLSEIAFSKDIYSEKDTELESILNQAVEDKLFLFENAYYDAVDNGYDPGPIEDAYERDGSLGYKEYVFPHGAIMQSHNNEYVYINEEFYEEIISLHKAGHLRDYDTAIFPRAEVIVKEKEVSYLLFSEWALFYISKEHRFVRLPKEFLRRYLAADTKEFGPWYPLTEPMQRIIAPKYKQKDSFSYVEFSNGMIMWSVPENADRVAFLLPSRMFSKLDFRPLSETDPSIGSASEDQVQYEPMFHAPSHMSGAIPRPIADYSVTYDNDGNVFNYCLPCQECQAYYFPRWDAVVISDRNIGSPKSMHFWPKVRDFENFNAECCDFENGVVVKYSSPQEKIVVHSSVELRPDCVTTGKIDDFTDADAEVFLKLSVYTEKGIIVENKDLGSHSLSAGKNYTFNARDGWNRFLLEPLQSDSFIRVIIKVYDYDLCSQNDYLGRFDYQYDVFNGWGIDFHDTGIYTLPMTERGEDSEKGVWTNKLTLALGEHYTNEELTRNWRRSFGFPFGNFKGCYAFNENQFARVFDNVKALSDLKHNFWRLGGLLMEGIFYGICQEISSSAKCGGFSIASAEAFYGQGAFIPPLYGKLSSSIINKKDGGEWRYEDIKPEVADLIVDRYFRQVGWDYLMWVWKKMTSGEFDSFERSIEKIKKRIDQEGCCLVLMYPKNLQVSEAHLLLAYKYEGNGLNTKFYVVESNCPYDPSSPEDVCTLTFKKNRVYLYINPKQGSSQEFLSDTTFSHVMEIPFYLVNRRPRVPSVLDFLIGGLENMVLGFIEGSIDTLGGDVELDPLITNREWDSVSSKAADAALFTKVYPMSIGGADGKPMPYAHLFLCAADTINLSFRKAAAGNVSVTLVSAKTKVVLNTQMKEKETLTINTEHLNEIHGTRIGVKRTGAEGPVSMMLYRSVAPGLHSHKFKHTLNVNRNGSFIEGSKFGIRLTAAKKDSAGNVAGKEILKAERNVKSTWNPYFSKAPKDPGATVMNDYFSVKQYANVYKCSEASVRQACRDSFIAGAFKKNRKWVVPAKSRIVSTK